MITLGEVKRKESFLPCSYTSVVLWSLHFLLPRLHEFQLYQYLRKNDLEDIFDLIIYYSNSSIIESALKKLSPL